MSETFTDPFVVSDGIHGRAPWWLSPQRELPRQHGGGRRYREPSRRRVPGDPERLHYPQNEALAQWFDTGQPSDALDEAFSYPNESVLTSPATFQNVKCAP
jgi:hypothetical protein